MSEIKSESISSLVDNYTPSSDEEANAQLVDNMLKDEDLSSTWQNYHLIGDVLRDEAPETISLDLSDTIAQAIAQEATILSPNSAVKATDVEFDENHIEKTEEAQPIASNRVIDATNRFKAKLSSLVKPMGQVAIAASAAGLMIVGVQSNVASNVSPVTQSQVVQTTPLAGFANPVSFNIQSSPSSQLEQLGQGAAVSQQAMDEQAAADRIAQQRRLQALLKDHHQQAKLGTNNQ